MSSKKTFEMVLTALFTAIIIIMAFVPYLVSRFAQNVTELRAKRN